MIRGFVEWSVDKSSSHTVNKFVGSSLTWYGVGLSDIGRVRSYHQDAFVILNPIAVWGIADGMGGLPGGDIASQLAIRTAADFLHDQLQDLPLMGDQKNSEALLREAIRLSNKAIRSEAHRNPKLTGMGTTLVLLRLFTADGTFATVAHVGDSRAYLLSGGNLTRLTCDHSAVEEYIRKGLITPEQAFNHPHRHILSRAMGVSERVEPDVSTFPLQADDLLLLCTDGLTKMIEDDALATMLAHGDSRPEVICRRLVEEANERGGDDNVTVVAIKAARINHLP
jgi:serine/threonine protein phosphatase PrpC